MEEKAINVDPAVAVRDAQDLLYREQELGALVKAIDQGIPAILLGERRMGKTSLLLVLSRELEKRGYSVKKIPSGYDREMVMREIVFCCVQELSSAEQDRFFQEGDGRAQIEEAVSTFESFINLLIKIIPADRKGKLVLMFDEIDSTLHETMQFSQTDAGLISEWLSLLGANRELLFRFLFTATHMSLLSTPIFQSAAKVRIAPWSRNQLAGVAKRALPNCIFGEQALEELYELTGGYPWFSKVIFQALMKLRETDLQILGRVSIDTLAPLIKTLFDLILHPPREYSSISSLLALIDASLKNMATMHFSKAELEFLVKDEITTEDLDTESEPMFDALVERGYLEKVGDTFRPRIKFFSMWLKAEWDFLR